MAIKITGKFDTGGGEYPLIEDIHLEGGFRVVATTEERDNIPDLRKKVGMVVYNQEDQKFWQLQDDLLSWVEVSLGGNANFDGWEGEVETYADLPDPADHLGEQWLVQKATGTWVFFNRKKAGLYEARTDDEGNPNWFYLGVQIHKISDAEKQNPCEVNEVRRYTPKDICDIIDTKTYWKKEDADTGIGEQLVPNENTENVQRVYIERNAYGIVEFNATNTNNDDNYTGASFTASTSADPYAKQVFLTMYGDNFYQTYLAGKGGNLTDTQLVVGAYGDNAQYDVVLGDDFGSLSPYFIVKKTNYQFTKEDNPIFYAYGKNPKAKPNNPYVIGVDTSTGELFSFNLSADPTNKVFIYRKGEDISGKNLLFLKRYIYKSRNLIKVYVNDEVFEDWDFGDQVESLNPDYTTHLKFNSALNDDDKIKIEYVEPIGLGDYKLVLYRKEGANFIISRPKMITKFITDQGGIRYYLDSVDLVNTSYGFERYICHYKGVNNRDYTIDVEKASPNLAYIAEFPKETDLPDGFVIEVWARDSKSPAKKHIPDNKEAQGRLVPVGKFTRNKIYNLDKNGVYHFRMIKVDNSGDVLFSQWLSSVVSVRNFPVFTTDPEDNVNTFVGHYKLMKII